jgi:hypothetical protein
MNPLNPKKLLLTKWTAVKPIAKPACLLVVFRLCVWVRPLRKHRTCQYLLAMVLKIRSFEG